MPRRSAVLLPLAGLLLLSGCGGSASEATPTTSAATSSPEPGPAQAAVSAEAAADPAAATDPGSAAVSTALRAADLPDGWTVQANPVPDGDLSNNPSLTGICGGDFPSEAHRTAKYPVTGVDPQGSPGVASEAISYDSAASAMSALNELHDAFDTCTSKDRTLVTAPRVAGLAPNFVVVEYDLAGGSRQEVIAQARGAVVSILIAEDETAAAAAARSIAVRMAALPASAIDG